MRSKDFQDMLAKGSFTLPLAGIIASVYWLFGPSPSPTQPDTGLWGWVENGLPPAPFGPVAGLVAGLLSVGLLWGFTVHHSLIRIPSTFYLTLYAGLSACGLPHTLQPGILLTCCLIGTFFFLFHSYQCNEPTVQLFQGFFFIGLGSLLFPPLWWLLPVILCLQVWLRTYSLRTFCACLVGLATPYWFLLGYTALCGQSGIWQQFVHDLTTFYPPVYSAVPASTWLVLAFVFVLALWSSVHYFFRSFQDKMRTRTFIYYLMAVEAASMAFVLLQPIHASVLLSPIIALCALLAGQYFAVTRNRQSLAASIVTLAALLALFVFNLWTQPCNSF